MICVPGAVLDCDSSVWGASGGAKGGALINIVVCILSKPAGVKQTPQPFSSQTDGTV